MGKTDPNVAERQWRPDCRRICRNPQDQSVEVGQTGSSARVVYAGPAGSSIGPSTIKVTAKPCHMQLPSLKSCPGGRNGVGTHAKSTDTTGGSCWGAPRRAAWSGIDECCRGEYFKTRLGNGDEATGGWTQANVSETRITVAGVDANPGVFGVTRDVRAGVEGDDG